MARNIHITISFIPHCKTDFRRKNFWKLLFVLETYWWFFFFFCLGTCVGNLSKKIWLKVGNFELFLVNFETDCKIWYSIFIKKITVDYNFLEIPMVSHIRFVISFKPFLKAIHYTQTTLKMCTILHQSLFCISFCGYLGNLKRTNLFC